MTICMLASVQPGPGIPRTVFNILTIISTCLIVLTVSPSSKNVKRRQCQCVAGKEVLKDSNLGEASGRMSSAPVSNSALHSLFGQFFAYCTESRSFTNCRKGQVIFVQGSDERSLFAVREGLVKLVASSEDGREVIVDVLGEGDLFGEDVLFANAPKRYSAVCITYCKILRLDPKQLWKSIRGNPESAPIFIEYFLKRTQTLYDQLANCLLNGGAKRLMLTLISHEERLGRLRMNQQTLGEMIGMTRQYVNVLLKEFHPSKSKQERMESLRPALSDVFRNPRIPKPLTTGRQ